jgi:hypothetical protein
VDTGNEGEQSGIASQIVAELVEGTQSFLGLGDKVGIILKRAEAERIVDMEDGNLMLAQHLAEKHVFIAIMPETLVEWVFTHDVAPHEEIGGVDVLIGGLLPLFGCMARGLGCLVTITQVAFQMVDKRTDSYAAVDDSIAVSIEIVSEKPVADDGHIAVDEEQVGVVGLLCEEVTDSSATNIL